MPPVSSVSAPRPPAPWTINRPTDLTVSDISTNSATLSWTPGGSETSWNVAYKKATDENWIQQTVTTTTCVLDPIDAGYTFDARVQAVTPNGESAWTSTQFNTPYCEDSDMGNIAFSLSDSYGDGWNNNKIQVVNAITDAVVAELTCPNGVKSPSTYDGVVNVCYNTPYNFVWVEGSYPSEVIFSFTNPNTEEVIFNCSSGNASNYKAGDIIFTYTLEKEVFPRPTDLTASNVTYNSADLNWMAHGAETAWQIVYDTNANFDPDGIDLIPIDVTGTPSHTLANLAPETTYYARVRANYGDGNVSSWSNLCSFTTPERYARPTGLTASNVTYDSAALTWTANGMETAWQIVYDTHAYFDPDGIDLIPIDVTGTSAHTLTGLTPDATYYAYVRAKYGNGIVSQWSDKCSFTTLEQYNKPTNLTVDDVKGTQVTLSWEGEAGNYNLRYCTASIDIEESFEEGMPSTWKTIDNNGDGNNWLVVNSSTYFSDGSFPAPDGDYVVMSRSYVNGVGITPDNWLITPKVPLGGELSYYIMDDGSFYETYRIYVSTTGTDVADFIPVTDDMHSPSSQNWTPMSVNLNDFAGQEGYIAFRHYNCNDRDFMFIDDIKIIGGNAGEWTVVNDQTSPSTITGLVSETYYLAEVQAVYDEGVSSWTAPVLFNTLSSTSMPSTPEVTMVTQSTATVEWTGAQKSYNLRYRKSLQKVGFFEDFESGTLNGWTNIDQDGDGYKWNIWDPTANNLGTDDKYGNLTLFDKRCATSASYAQSALTPDNWLISPQVELKGTLSVWLRAQDPDWTEEHFAIYASTTGTDIDDFTVVLQDTTQSQGVLTEYTADLSQFNGQMGYIAIRHFDSNNQFRLNVDNFHVKHAEDIPAEEWIVEENVTSPYIITGLDPDTKYEVEVQGILDDESTTDWTPTVNFKTINAVTLAEALTGHSGEVLIISDMKVMISTSDFASATDGDDNWIILFSGTPLAVGDVITNVVGKITLGANPMLDVKSYESSDAVIDVPEKELDLANIQSESITALKPGEKVSFLGYYNTSTGEICAFSPETGNVGLHLGVSTYYMTGSVVEGEKQQFTGMAYLREAWDNPSSISAHAPARVAIDDELAYENVYVYITETFPPVVTGVETVKVINGKEIEGIYNVNGQKVTRADKGIYIIRYTDGSAQKVRF